MSKENTTDKKARNRERRRRSQILILSVILLILLLAAAAVGFLVFKVLMPTGTQAAKKQSTSDFTWVRSIYGWGAKDAQQLVDPSDVAIDGDGNIYVAWNVGQAIVQFRPDGSFVKMIGPGSMGAGSPSPIKTPTGVSADEDGTVYVSDDESNRVFVFDQDGKMIRSWKVNLARDVQVAGDRVYVGASGSVGVFDKKGKLIFAVGTKGRKKDQFESPVGVAVAKDGTFYVADALNGRIVAYSDEGKLLWVYPKYGENARPATGNLSGSASRSATGSAEFTLPLGITLDANGRILVMDGFKFRLSVIEPTAKGAKTIARYGEQGPEDGKLMYPGDIAFDANRDWVVVADVRNNRLQVFRVKGTGGATGLQARLRTMSLGPIWVCAVPLLAILIALILLFLTRGRRNRFDRKTGQDAPFTDDVARDPQLD